MKHRIHHWRKAFHYHISDNVRYKIANYHLQTQKCPILIYTMGKVASKSIAVSLKNLLPNSVYHIHSLDVNKIKKAESDCFEKGIYPDGRQKGFLVYQHKIAKHQPVKIITTIREPIARNMSAFFEVFKFHTGYHVNEWKGGFDELYHLFIQKLNHNYPLTWFDEEFKNILGLNIYDYAFNSEQKFQLIKKDNLDVLLLRVDLPDLEKEKQIKKFLDLADFKLINENIGLKKEYADLYSHFKNEIKPSIEYVNSMLNSNFTKHFFSAIELDDLKKKYLSEQEV